MFDVHDERLARAAWSRVAEPGDQVAVALVDQLGAGPALEWLHEAARDPAGARRALVRLADDGAPGGASPAREGPTSVPAVGGSSGTGEDEPDPAVRSTDRRAAEHHAVGRSTDARVADHR